MFVQPQQEPAETHLTPTDQFSSCGEYNEMAKGSLSFYFTNSHNYVLFLNMHIVLLDECVYKLSSNSHIKSLPWRTLNASQSFSNRAISA